MLKPTLVHALQKAESAPAYELHGRVTAVLGLLIECAGLKGRLGVGRRCLVMTRDDSPVICEVTGFRADRGLLMPFGSVEGIGLGCRVMIAEAEPVVSPGMGWLGRVVNAFGDPLDGRGEIPRGTVDYRLRNAPPPAHDRKRIGPKIDLGVSAVNSFLSCCRGQRMGIFSGSGIGKSILLSMFARYTSADVNVIGLVGERGREVREFIEDDLGSEGLARSVVIVATSDESPLMRRQAAYLTMAVAECFRDAGKNVLCLMDSVTRFAMAQREIGLSAGEPPTTKGYTPTVFVELPKLLERAGPGTGQGAITGIFTVLVEGDDHNEPISDAIRGIIDGHIILDRAIAERGRFPAINILRSVSRAMPKCNSEAENQLVQRAKTLMATYEDMSEMIRLGAYRMGADPAVDEAIQYHEALENCIAQDQNERRGLADSYAALAECLNEPVS